METGTEPEPEKGSETDTDTEMETETEREADMGSKAIMMMMIKKLGTIMLLATISGSCAALVFACFWLFDKRMYG